MMDNKKHLKRSMQKNERKERKERKEHKTVVTVMPTFDAGTLDTVNERLLTQHFSFLDTVFVKLKHSNGYLADFIKLASGEDELIRKVLTGTVIFINECGAIPVINKHVYEDFMCFEESPEETERINKERIDAIADKTYIECAQAICAEDPQCYCFVLCLYILLDMQCKLNKGLTIFGDK